MRHAVAGGMVVLGLWAGGAMLALGQEVTGKQIAERIYNRDDGADSVFTVKMTLVDRRGRERERTMVTYSKDAEDGLVNTFMQFESPADIKGTRFLTLEQRGEDDTQYLYMPALGRSRRIVGGQRQQSFVNTDFTFEDMERRHPDDDLHTLKREEKFKEWDCYVIETVPGEGRDSQYSKSVVWMDKASDVVVKVDFYDQRERHVKQLRVNRLEKKDGIWTAMDTEMENLTRGTRTRLVTLDVKYNQGLDDSMFTLRHLEEK